MNKKIIADKGNTIKGASDEQLQALIRRLRNERELQDLIGSIKRQSTSGNDPYSDYPGNQQVSTEEPIDSLYHYGILGMKWGVRRDRPSALVSKKTDSSITKNVKNDYNKLSDKEFIKKYQASKDTYAKRVSKYGDPYMNAPLAKIGKKIGTKSSKNIKEDITKLSDIELKQRLNRIDMEKRYSQITKQETSKGSKFVKDVLSTSAKTTAVAFTTKAMTDVIKTAMKSVK